MAAATKPRIFIAVDIEATGAFCPYIDGALTPDASQRLAFQRLIKEKSRYADDSATTIVEDDGDDDDKKEEVVADKLPTDELIAFSTVAFTVDTGERRGKILGVYRFVNSKFMVARKPAQWRRMWKENNWEMRCWTEFWSKHTDKLNLMCAPLQGAAICIAPVAELMFRFSEWMFRFEMQGNTEILTDTGNFDLFWLSVHLLSVGHSPMAYTRAGEYRGATNVRDMTIGHVAPLLLGEWKVLKAALAPWRDADPATFFERRECAMFNYDGAHLPEWDAFKIAVEFCANVIPANAQLGAVQKALFGSVYGGTSLAAAGSELPLQ